MCRYVVVNLRRATYVVDLRRATDEVFLSWQFIERCDALGTFERLWTLIDIFGSVAYNTAGGAKRRKTLSGRTD